MKRKQSINIVQECKALVDIESSNSDSDIILILDEDDTDVSLKQEKMEVPLTNKEEQELSNDTSAVKRNSSAPNWKRAPVGDVNPGSGQKARPCESSGYKADSLPTQSSQSTSVKETVKKLTSNLREVLLYFFPEYQLPPEFDHVSLEELVTSSELEQCPEQTNKKLKMCFNQDGFIDVLEFIAAVNLIVQGKMEQKLKWYFKLYDADGNGSIDKKELLNIFMAVQALNGQQALSPEEFTNLVFRKIDINNDGELTLEEFISGIEKDQDLLELVSKSFDLSNVLKVICNGKQPDPGDALLTAT